MIEYTLTRSKRKTIAIHITKIAAVEVRAPMKMPKKDIDKFVQSKEGWIETHLTKRERLNDEKSVFELNYGDMVTLCGKQYPIAVKNGNRADFDGECFNIPPGLTPEAIKDAVVKIYKSMAKRIINDKVAEYAKRLNATPTAIRITSAKTRWGSCSGKNSVNFSWRLVMADDDVIDYVVVHELAHIKEHNHSSRFWAVVESVLPDYTARKRKLKALQSRLSQEDWD